MSRPIAGVPFDPAVLRNEGEIPAFPETPDFDPAGSWSLTYRLVGARGFQGENTTVGFVHLQRSVAGEDQFQFRIKKLLVLQEAMVNELTATVDCTVGMPAIVRQWTHLSEHRDTEGNNLPNLRLEQVGAIRNGRIEVRVGDHHYHPHVRAPWTTEFLLFEALQRLSADTDAALRFDLFEDFAVLKHNQRLYSRGADEYDLGEAGVLRLHRYDHIGMGIVPFEYYVDDQQRLLVAISGNQFLILEDHDRAVDAAEEFRQRQVRTYEWRVRNPA